MSYGLLSFLFAVAVIIIIYLYEKLHDKNPFQRTLKKRYGSSLDPRGLDIFLHPGADQHDFELAVAECFYTFPELLTPPHNPDFTKCISISSPGERNLCFPDGLYFLLDQFPVHDFSRYLTNNTDFFIGGPMRKLTVPSNCESVTLSSDLKNLSLLIIKCPVVVTARQDRSSCLGVLYDKITVPADFTIQVPSSLLEAYQRDDSWQQRSFVTAAGDSVIPSFAPIVQN